jgi:uncharacterized protein YndB with AHSA1/START domain
MTETNSADARTLVLTRTLKASRAKVFRCWTEPALIVQWFAPKPWTTPRAKVDLRPGGTNEITMADPEGNEFPNKGVYLDVEKDRRIVFTDAFTEAWVPSKKPFFVGEILLEDAPGGGTLYTATARHWTEEDCRNHEAMGFHDGWGQCADQLDEVAQRL